jgi:pimeloyl-ACP methyl ester carboxylesterase
LLFGAAAALADDADWIAVKGATAERVRVPVFNGDVVLYRAGKRGAEPIILIHGLSRSGARDWAQVIPALAGSYDVYTVDLPGFGASDKGNHLYSPSNYVRVLDALFGQRLTRPPIPIASAAWSSRTSPACCTVRCTANSSAGRSPSAPWATVLGTTRW